jgi:hypothetical protein
MHVRQHHDEDERLMQREFWRSNRPMSQHVYSDYETSRFGFLNRLKCGGGDLKIEGT